VFTSWTNSFSSLLCIILISNVLKNRLSNVTRVLALMVLIGAVGALGISALPNSAAMSPSVSFIPTTPVVEGSAPTIVLTTPFDPTIPSLDVRIGFTEPPSTGILTMADPTGGPAAGGGGDCGLRLYDPASTGGSYWAFEDGVGNEVEFDMMSAGDTVSILFAAGVINPIYGGTGTATGPASGQWIDKSPNNKAPSIDFLTNPLVFPPDEYTVEYCGWDTNSGATNSLFQDDARMQTQLSMAGEIIPIDATALVLGGITTPTMMLPLLAIAAGGAFVYLRFQVLRKD